MKYTSHLVYFPFENYLMLATINVTNDNKMKFNEIERKQKRNQVFFDICCKKQLPPKSTGGPSSLNPAERYNA
jgi:DNA phosphorothioation-dependent restriction protein DptG